MFSWSYYSLDGAAKKSNFWLFFVKKNFFNFFASFSLINTSNVSKPSLSHAHKSFWHESASVIRYHFFCHPHHRFCPTVKIHLRGWSAYHVPPFWFFVFSAVVTPRLLIYHSHKERQRRRREKNKRDSRSENMKKVEMWIVEMRKFTTCGKYSPQSKEYKEAIKNDELASDAKLHAPHKDSRVVGRRQSGEYLWRQGLGKD